MRKGQIDYNKEIPFEKRPAVGFYDTSDEKYVGEKMHFDKLRQHDLDEKRRDEAENRERKKDAKKLKERKENDGLAGKAARQRKEILWAKDSDELRLVPLRQPTGGKSESLSPMMVSKFVPLKRRQEVLRSENRKRERGEEERRNQIQVEEEGWDAIGDLFDQ